MWHLSAEDDIPESFQLLHLNHSNFSKSADQAADDVKEVDVVDLENRLRLATTLCIKHWFDAQHSLELTPPTEIGLAHRRRRCASELSGQNICLGALLRIKLASLKGAELSRLQKCSWC